MYRQLDVSGVQHPDKPIKKIILLLTLTPQVSAKFPQVNFGTVFGPGLQNFDIIRIPGVYQDLLSGFYKVTGEST